MLKREVLDIQEEIGEEILNDHIEQVGEVILKHYKGVNVDSWIVSRHLSAVYVKETVENQFDVIGVIQGKEVWIDSFPTKEKAQALSDILYISNLKSADVEQKSWEDLLNMLSKIMGETPNMPNLN